MQQSGQIEQSKTDWSVIVRDHGALVYRTAYQLLNRDADAADCFQQTFLSAIQLEMREPIRNWPATLVRLATSRAVEQLRRRYRHTKSQEPIVEEPVVFSDPAIGLAADELSDHLRMALSEIDPIQADVFCLVCIEEMSNVEAAEVLGIGAGHLGVLLQRARNAIKRRLTMFDPAREKQS